MDRYRIIRASSGFVAFSKAVDGKTINSPLFKTGAAADRWIAEQQVEVAKQRLRGQPSAGYLRMSDQIIDAAMARTLHDDACRTHLLVGWIVMRDPPNYPNKFIACLAIDVPKLHVLIGETLADIHQQLPSGLVRSALQPSDPSNVVEVWFSR